MGVKRQFKRRRNRTPDYDFSKNTNTEITEEQKGAVIKDLLLSSNKDEDVDVKKKKADELALGK
jgi:hypothetical protein